MAGLRLARAYTGKDDYVILEGSYHGLFDAAMWFTPMDKWSQVGDPEIKPYSEGVPVSTKSFAHFVQANDANQLEDVFKRHAGAHRLPADRADHGQLPRHRRGARVSAHRARSCATSTAWCCSSMRSRPAFASPAAACRSSTASRPTCAPSPRRSATAIRSRCSPDARTSCARSGTASRTAAPTRRIRCRSPRRRRPWRSSMRPTRWSASPITARACAPACARSCSARGIAHSFVGHPSMSGLYFAHEPAAQLSRLEEQRLLVLRRDGAGAAR